MKLSLKTCLLPFLIAMFALCNVCLPLRAPAQGFQLVTQRDSSQPPPAGANGDSTDPVLSKDGRYVLFASTANNLVLTTSNTVLPTLLVPVANVYLRDRTNGTATLVSVNVAGTAGGNSDSLPVQLSDDSRYILFESRASDLVADDSNNAADIFVRDVRNATTTLVSVSTNGAAGNGTSREPVMTPDARYIAFVSSADSLVSGDTNGIPDIFVRDLQSGTTALASVSAARRTGFTLAGSGAPEITPDGQYVVFHSAATNLVPGVPAGGDVYVRDLVNGITHWASSGARAAWGASSSASNIISYNHRISQNGHFVAYESSQVVNGTPLLGGRILRWNQSSTGTELVHTNAAVSVAAYEDIRNLDLTSDGQFIAFVANTNGINRTNTCICVWDAQSGSITLASVALNGSAPANSVCDWPVFDSAGRYVAFLSTAPNLVTNSIASGYHIYIRDLQNASTVLVDQEANSLDAPLGPATVPQVSGGGRFVAFSASDGSFVSDDRNHSEDVFCTDWNAGAVELISSAALPSQTPNGLSMLAPSSISADGRLVVFGSDADNFITGDTNRYRDIYVRDLAAGTSSLASVATNGFAPHGPSTDPAISADGRFVAFSSLAANLVAGDVNGYQDVFLRDLETGTNALVSANLNNNGAGTAASYMPLVSHGGRYVLYRSRANNLASGAFSTTYENLFVRDMVARCNFALTTSGTGLAAMTPDGRYVAYAAGSPASSWQVYVWDVYAAGRIYTNNGTSTAVQTIAIADGGRRCAYALSSSTSVSALYQVELPGRVRVAVEPSIAGTYGGLRLSAGGRFLVCTKRTSGSGSNQVYLFDLDAGTNTLVSRTYDAALASNGPSDSPTISADGRFVAYRSAANDIVSGDLDGRSDVFVFDVQNGTNVLLTAGQNSPNHNSSMPVFSGDGQTLFFQSMASNLAANDFNHYSDIFASPFLYVAIMPGTNSSQGPWLSWPWVQGRNYRVEFKDSPGDPVWQELGGSITNSGNKAWLQDTSPNPLERVYRVKAH